ncbi:hypothetical protein PENVUL_c016G04964 [Penicillium vulpinum]|uniref:Uncharacterized protein n=1 Tax=Penicillium vulpinum TaxID=29845 RepID=A0A1V6RYZ9_9EURO|nr:hypothetical protein PENVUL_c016G04964 [Penicillium vulpinum]
MADRAGFPAPILPATPAGVAAFNTGSIPASILAEPPDAEDEAIPNVAAMILLQTVSQSPH